MSKKRRKGRRKTARRKTSRRKRAVYSQGTSGYNANAIVAIKKKLTDQQRFLEKQMGKAFGAITLGMHRKKAAPKKRRAAVSAPKKRRMAVSAPKKRRTKKSGGTVTAAQIIKMAKSNALKTWACRGITRTGCGGSGSRVVKAKGSFKRVRPRARLPC